MDLGKGLRTAMAKLTGAKLVDEAAVKEFLRDVQRVLIANDVPVKLVGLQHVNDGLLRLLGVVHALRLVNNDDGMRIADVLAVAKPRGLLLFRGDMRSIAP